MLSNACLGIVSSSITFILPSCCISYLIFEPIHSSSMKTWLYVSHFNWACWSSKALRCSPSNSTVSTSTHISLLSLLSLLSLKNFLMTLGKTFFLSQWIKYKIFFPGGNFSASMRALAFINSVFPLPGPPMISCFFGPSNAASWSIVNTGAHRFLRGRARILTFPPARFSHSSLSRFVQLSPSRNPLWLLSNNFESSFSPVTLSALAKPRSVRVLAVSTIISFFFASVTLFMNLVMLSMSMMYTVQRYWNIFVSSPAILFPRRNFLSERWSLRTFKRFALQAVTLTLLRVCKASLNETLAIGRLTWDIMYLHQRKRWGCSTSLILRKRPLAKFPRCLKVSKV